MTTGFLANAGTPLMWAPIGHLLFGNLLIALLEAGVIRMAFRLSYGRAFLLALAANYVSAIAGLMGLEWVMNLLQPLLLGTPPIFDLARYVMAMIVVAFVLSLILEWPILRFIPPKGRRTLGYTLAIALAAQVASHCLLVPYYSAASANTIADNAELETSPSFAATPDWWIYYLDNTGKGLRRVRVNGQEDRFIVSADSIPSWAKMKLSPHGEGRVAILAETTDGGTQTVLELGPAEIVFAERFEPDPWWQVTDLRPDAEARKGWTAHGGSWSWYGMIASNNRESRRIAVELPSLAWPVRNITIVPGDQIVFDLGPQIMLYDPQTRQLAVITMGTRPVVVPDSELLRKAPDE